MTATLTYHSFPLNKRTELSYPDLLNIKYALATEAKSYRKVKMKKEADEITSTLRKISAIIAKQPIKKHKTKK